MGALARRKGWAGEQEVAKLLRDHLGLAVAHTWQQSAAVGGADLTGIPGWSVEIKRCKEYSRQWWAQTLQQARDADALPALVYRLDNFSLP